MKEQVNRRAHLARKLAQEAWAPLRWQRPARFAVLLGLIWRVRRRVLSGMAGLLIRRGAHGHAVIQGEDGSADALALASAESGEVVVLCDPSLPDDDDRAALLGAAGVICLPALPDNLHNASALALWQPADADNIASAIALRSGLRSRLKEAELHLAVQSPELHRELLQAPDLMLDHTMRLRPHSLAGNAMRAVFAGPDLPALACAKGQARVTLCLWGTSESLHWAAEYALRQMWSAQLCAPCVYWVKGDAGGQEASLPPSLAHFTHHAQAVFGPADCPQVTAIAADTAYLDAQVTCHMVGAGGGDITAADAFALAARLRQGAADPPPVQPVLTGEPAISDLFAADAMTFRAPILPGTGLTIEQLHGRLNDEAAARLHLAYDRKFGGGGSTPASGRWQDLPETYVAANRAAADHMAIKHWDAASSGLEGSALIEALARTEHHRWCAERLLAGWAPSVDTPRDNAGRLHPDLRPWDALSEEARDKDREQVREVLAKQP